MAAVCLFVCFLILENKSYNIFYTYAMVFTTVNAHLEQYKKWTGYKPLFVFVFSVRAFRLNHNPRITFERDVIKALYIHIQRERDWCRFYGCRRCLFITQTSVDTQVTVDCCGKRCNQPRISECGATTASTRSSHIELLMNFQVVIW